MVRSPPILLDQQQPPREGNLVSTQHSNIFVNGPVGEGDPLLNLRSYKRFSISILRKTSLDPSHAHPYVCLEPLDTLSPFAEDDFSKQTKQVTIRGLVAESRQKDNYSLWLDNGDKAPVKFRADQLPPMSVPPPLSLPIQHEELALPSLCSSRRAGLAKCVENGSREVREEDKTHILEEDKVTVGNSKSEEKTVIEASKMPQAMGDVCPVCKKFSSTSTVSLNAHINRCLDKELPRDRGTLRQRNKTQGQKGKKSGKVTGGSSVQKIEEEKGEKAKGQRERWQVKVFEVLTSQRPGRGTRKVGKMEQQIGLRSVGTRLMKRSAAHQDETAAHQDEALLSEGNDSDEDNKEHEELMDGEQEDEERTNGEQDQEKDNEDENEAVEKVDEGEKTEMKLQSKLDIASGKVEGGKLYERNSQMEEGSDVSGQEFTAHGRPQMNQVAVAQRPAQQKYKTMTDIYRRAGRRTSEYHQPIKPASLEIDDDLCFQVRKARHARDERRSQRWQGRLKRAREFEEGDDGPMENEEGDREVKQAGSHEVGESVDVLGATAMEVENEGEKNGDNVTLAENGEIGLKNVSDAKQGKGKGRKWPSRSNLKATKRRTRRSVDSQIEDKLDSGGKNQETLTGAEASGQKSGGNDRDRGVEGLGERWKKRRKDNHTWKNAEHSEKARSGEIDRAEKGGDSEMFQSTNKAREGHLERNNHVDLRLKERKIQSMETGSGVRFRKSAGEEKLLSNVEVKIKRVRERPIRFHGLGLGQTTLRGGVFAVEKQAPRNRLESIGGDIRIASEEVQPQSSIDKENTQFEGEIRDSGEYALENAKGEDSVKMQGVTDVSEFVQEKNDSCDLFGMSSREKVEDSPVQQLEAIATDVEQACDGSQDKIALVESKKDDVLAQDKVMENSTCMEKTSPFASQLIAGDTVASGTVTGTAGNDREDRIAGSQLLNNEVVATGEGLGLVACQLSREADINSVVCSSKVKPSKKKRSHSQEKKRKICMEKETLVKNVGIKRRRKFPCVTISKRVLQNVVLALAFEPVYKVEESGIRVLADTPMETEARASFPGMDALGTVAVMCLEKDMADRAVITEDESAVSNKSYHKESIPGWPLEEQVVRDSVLAEPTLEVLKENGDEKSLNPPDGQHGLLGNTNNKEKDGKSKEDPSCQLCIGHSMVTGRESGKAISSLVGVSSSFDPDLAPNFLKLSCPCGSSVCASPNGGWVRSCSQQGAIVPKTIDCGTTVINYSATQRPPKLTVRPRGSSALCHQSQQEEVLVDKGGNKDRAECPELPVTGGYASGEKEVVGHNKMLSGVIGGAHNNADCWSGSDQSEKVVQNPMNIPELPGKQQSFGGTLHPKVMPTGNFPVSPPLGSGQDSSPKSKFHSVMAFGSAPSGHATHHTWQGTWVPWPGPSTSSESIREREASGSSNLLPLRTQLTMQVHGGEGGAPQASGSSSLLAHKRPYPMPILGEGGTVQNGTRTGQFPFPIIGAGGMNQFFRQRLIMPRPMPAANFRELPKFIGACGSLFSGPTAIGGSKGSSVSTPQMERGSVRGAGGSPLSDGLPRDGGSPFGQSSVQRSDPSLPKIFNSDEVSLSKQKVQQETVTESSCNSVVETAASLVDSIEANVVPATTQKLLGSGGLVVGKQDNVKGQQEQTPVVVIHHSVESNVVPGTTQTPLGGGALVVGKLDNGKGQPEQVSVAVNHRSIESNMVLGTTQKPLGSYQDNGKGHQEQVTVVNHHSIESNVVHGTTQKPLCSGALVVGKQDNGIGQQEQVTVVNHHSIESNVVHGTTQKLLGSGALVVGMQDNGKGHQEQVTEVNHHLIESNVVHSTPQKPLCSGALVVGKQDNGIGQQEQVTVVNHQSIESNVVHGTTQKSLGSGSLEVGKQDNGKGQQEQGPVVVNHQRLKIREQARLLAAQKIQQMYTLVTLPPSRTYIQEVSCRKDPSSTNPPVSGPTVLTDPVKGGRVGKQMVQDKANTAKGCADCVETGVVRPKNPTTKSGVTQGTAVNSKVLEDHVHGRNMKSSSPFNEPQKQGIGGGSAEIIRVHSSTSIAGSSQGGGPNLSVKTPGPNGQAQQSLRRKDGLFDSSAMLISPIRASVLEQGPMQIREKVVMEGTGKSVPNTAPLPVHESDKTPTTVVSPFPSREGNQLSNMSSKVGDFGINSNGTASKLPVRRLETDCGVTGVTTLRLFGQNLPAGGELTSSPAVFERPTSTPVHVATNGEGQNLSSKAVEKMVMEIVAKEEQLEGKDKWNQPPDLSMMSLRRQRVVNNCSGGRSHVAKIRSLPVRLPQGTVSNSLHVTGGSEKPKCSEPKAAIGSPIGNPISSPMGISTASLLLGRSRNELLTSPLPAEATGLSLGRNGTASSLGVRKVSGSATAALNEIGFDVTRSEIGNGNSRGRLSFFAPSLVASLSHQNLVTSKMVEDSDAEDKSRCDTELSLSSGGEQIVVENRKT